LNQNGKSQKRLLSQREAAEYLGISYWTLRDLNFQGILPYLKIGRRILIDLKDLEGYIQKSKVRQGI
jgi:excisionase family DNA binding protein